MALRLQGRLVVRFVPSQYDHRVRRGAASSVAPPMRARKRCFHSVGSENSRERLVSERREGRLILVRHGQSAWNVTDPSRGLTARFTGWADVGLTERGREQAVAAGQALAAYFGESGIKGKDRIDCIFTSLLSRARDTMDLMLWEMDLMGGAEARDEKDGRDHGGKYRVPVVSSWRLNERHYGLLVGLSKEGAERLYGKETLDRWRNDWETPPPPMNDDMVKRWGKEKHCGAVTYIDYPGDAASSFQVGQSHDRVPLHAARHELSHPIHHEDKGAQDHNVPQQLHNEQRKVYVATSSLPAISAEKMLARDVAIFEKPLQHDIGESSTARRHHVAAWPSRMPASESLRDTYERVLPLWTSAIAPRLRNGQTLLVIAHANTLRSILHSIDPTAVTRDAAKSVKIPSAVPLVYKFRPVLTTEEEKDAVPGGLVVVPADMADGSESCGDLEPRRKLHGQWIETEDIESLSFCTPIGQNNLEHEIA